MAGITRRRMLSALAAIGVGVIGWRRLSEEQPPPSLGVVPAVDTAPEAPEPAVLEVIERRGWGAGDPTGAYVPHVPERITVHHTGALLKDNRDAPSRVRAHQRFHQVERSWSDLAYHYVIDRAGNVYEGRPVDVVGDTATDYDPTGHLLPCLEGNFDQQSPSPEQLDALVRLMAWMVSEFDLDRGEIAAHRDFADTACPGDALYGRLGDLRDRVAAVMAVGVDLEVVEGSQASSMVAAIEA